MTDEWAFVVGIFFLISFGIFIIWYGRMEDQNHETYVQKRREIRKKANDFVKSLKKGQKFTKLPDSLDEYFYNRRKIVNDSTVCMFMTNFLKFVVKEGIVTKIVFYE